MFKCGFCGLTTQPKEPQALIVTETRAKEYIHGYEDDEERFPITSRGIETVKETPACLSCAKIREVWNDRSIASESPRLPEGATA